MQPSRLCPCQNMFGYRPCRLPHRKHLASLCICIILGCGTSSGRPQVQRSGRATQQSCVWHQADDLHQRRLHRGQWRHEFHRCSSLFVPFVSSCMSVRPQQSFTAALSGQYPCSGPLPFRRSGALEDCRAAMRTLGAICLPHQILLTVRQRLSF